MSSTCFAPRPRLPTKQIASRFPNHTGLILLLKKDIYLTWRMLIDVPLLCNARAQVMPILPVSTLFSDDELDELQSMSLKESGGLGRASKKRNPAA